MTTTIADPVERELWSSMPGWGIAADLMPPEVAIKRRTRTLRKVVVGGLVLVVLACAGATALSMVATGSAEESLAGASDRTVQLQAEQRDYTDVITSQAQTRALDGQLAALMAKDVDVAAFVGALSGRLPDSMTLSSVNVSLSTGDPATTGQVAGAAPLTPVVGTDGKPVEVIGTVTLGGNSRELDDLASYVNRLGSTDGVVNVVPTSNGAGGAAAGDAAGVTAWTVTLQLTDALYTHRYDAAPADGDQ